MSELVEKMEIAEDAPAEPTASKSKDFKYKLLERLNEPETSLTKSLTLAITIQTMFSKDLEVLEHLFEFYINKNQLEMSTDLWENELLKKVSLVESSHFDKHLNRIAEQIISHLDKKKQNLNNLNNLDPRDEFYLKLFLKLSQATQEKFVTLILEKYKSKFSFLKIEPPTQQALDAAKKTPQAISVDIKDLYCKLVDIKNDIFLTRDLLGIYKKFIPDYGIFLIDGLLNCEKSLYINFVQMSTNASEPMINIERRSLNIMRRLCVVDLIPYFIQIIDKLDNRHCYRWIEKSLEFFTKYTLSSIRVEFNETIKLTYSTVNLLNENEIPNLDDSSKYTHIYEQLKDLIEYKYTDKNTPFSEVFKLLDEIGKKLDWPSLQANQTIEDKLSALLSLKQKSDKQSSISISSLNKQFSFYAVALFFNKLIEFNAVSSEFFSNKLILVKRYKFTMNKPVASATADSAQIRTPIDFSVASLIYCLKLWHKFNSHKEFSNVVTKCLSNSKLDLMTIYKNFIAQYYTNYSVALNLQSATQPNWDTIGTLTSRQKLPALAHLFMNEKCDSFELFFRELLVLIEQSKQEQSNQENLNYAKFLMSNAQFNLFELTTNNVLSYFSWLIIEKLIQLLEIKKLLLHKFLTEKDQLLGHFLVLIQLNLSSDSLIIDVYDTIYQIIKTKANFVYPEFFDYIYDTQVLQDFSALNNNYKVNMQIGCDSTDLLMSKFIGQMNSHKSNEKYDLIEKFFKQNAQSMSDYFTQTLTV